MSRTRRIQHNMLQYKTSSMSNNIPETVPVVPAVPSAADYVAPLNINGLEGRMLHMPAPKGITTQTEILFIYGHHSSLERWWGLIQALNRYGAVTVPDLPGFGGMDSFYKIGKKPTVDAMADYLAAFIKLRYKRKKIVLIGLSFGFIVVTRMLQRYPELTKKVILLVSIVGFAHKDDFMFTKPRMLAYRGATKFMSNRVGSTIFRYTALQPFVLRHAYGRTHNAKHKFAQATDVEEALQLMEVEIGLWHGNDVQTWFYTTNEFFKLDNCTKRVDLPLLHVSSAADHFFDNNLVEQHMRVIFTGYEGIEIDMKTHAPSVIATEAEAAVLIPSKLRRKLKQVMKDAA